VDQARQFPVDLVERRQEALIAYMKRYFLAGDEGKIDPWHILALRRRLRCATWKPGLAVMQDRFAGIRSTFCDKYGQ